MNQIDKVPLPEVDDLIDSPRSGESTHVHNLKRKQGSTPTPNVPPLHDVTRRQPVPEKNSVQKDTLAESPSDKLPTAR